MGRILFDVSRLFVRGSRFSPTGIDRVVMAYARWLLSRSDLSLQPVLTAGGRILAAPRPLLAGLVEGAEAFSAKSRDQDATNADWQSLVQALDAKPGAAGALRAKSLLGQLPTRVRWHASALSRGLWRLRGGAIAPGDLYLNVSHTGLDHRNVLGGVAAAGGRCMVMVHDLIPITHPEYCSPRAKVRHERRIDHVFAHASSVIANSAATALALEEYARSLDRPAPPSLVAPLGVEVDFLSPPPPLAASAPYFVCVGTLEARKNLAFLLAIWRRLAERMGPMTPALVLVGRRGWENEAVLDHLQRSEAVARHVQEVSDLSDSHLARLIGGARALLAPSFAEGYDLPAVEAMSIGTPVIASDIAVHREFAAGAILLDPLDGPGWLAAIESAASADPRRTPCSGPSWEDHFAIVGPRLVV